MHMSTHLAQHPAAAILFTTIVLCILGCKKDDDEPTTQTIVVYVDTVSVPPNAVADVDGNIYPTTLIGTQRWMAENLRTSHYANGDPIPYVPTTQWSLQTNGAWTNYDTDASYDDLYGKLYNWYTVVDPLNACPEGWHVPSDLDWMELEESLGVPVADLDNTGPRGAAANAGGRLKAQSLWESPNTGANDSSAFSAFPGGDRSSNGSFVNVGVKGYWWSTSEFNTVQGWQRSLTYDNAGVYRQSSLKVVGASIRCVQD